MRKRMVAVVGSGECDAIEAEFARELGYRLAKDDLVVVTGGRGGVMEAVSRGAHEAGGLTLGILPGTDGEEGNPYLDIVVPSGMGELRNGLVVAAGDVVVAIGGEYGTLSEIGLALKAGKTVLGWRTWRPMHYREKEAVIHHVFSIDEVMGRIIEALHMRKGMEEL